jgi:recombination protein RecA
MAANCQKNNLIWNREPYKFNVAYINAEGAINNELVEIDGEIKLKNTWLSNIGVDPNDMFWIEPDTGEQLWEACHDLIQYNNVKYVICDSIHSMQPSIVHESSAGDSAVMAHASLHTKEVVKSLKILRENHAIILGINHLKVHMTAMGVMGEKAGGGKAWEFYSQFILEMSRTNSKAKLSDAEYIPLDLYLRKSKGGKSFVPFTTQAKQSFGIDANAELLEIALEKGLVKRSGAWLKSSTGETLGQGLSPEVLNWCMKNKDIILQSLYD